MAVSVPRTDDEREVLKWRNEIKAIINQFQNLPVYANNAAALAGGLKEGMFYRSGDNICVVH